MTPSWPVMIGCSSPRRRRPATRCRSAWQVRAISVMPSPVSTSDSVMSSDPQSGQTWAWKRTRKSVTAAHPCRGCRRGSAGRGGRVAGVGGDPGLGAGLVAGHVLDRGPVQRRAAAQHAGCERADAAVPPVQDYAAGRPLVASDMPKLSFALAGRGLFGWPGRGMAVPQARHLCQFCCAVRRARWDGGQGEDCGGGGPAGDPRWRT